MQTTTVSLAERLEQAAQDVDVRNFGELRRALRQRCAREGVDYRPIWTGTIVDFQRGCLELAASLRG